MQEVFNYIDGLFSPSVDGEHLDNLNPATGEVISLIPRSLQADVEHAASAALRAQPAWNALSLDQRALWLDRIADALEEKHEHIAQSESLGHRKTNRSRSTR